MRRIMPARGARISFSIFMASRTTSGVPASTLSPARTMTSTIWPGRLALTSPLTSRSGMGGRKRVLATLDISTL